LGLEYKDRILAGPIDPKLVDKLPRPVETSGGALAVASAPLKS
jgi:hypothetical protein